VQFRPIGGRKHQNREPTRREILLMPEIFVCRN